MEKGRMSGSLLKTANLFITYFVQVMESKVDTSAELCSHAGWETGDLEVEPKATVLSEEEVNVI